MTQAKIADIDGKIRTLKAMETVLSRLMDRCSGCGPVSDCPILESIDSEKVLQGGIVIFAFPCIDDPHALGAPEPCGQFRVGFFQGLGCGFR